MISDDSSLAGALLISDQLSTYRFMDSLSRGLQNRELAANYSTLRQRFSALVDDYNRLRSQAIFAAKEADRRGAALDEANQTITRLQAECERLREDNRIQAIDIKLLRNIVLQFDPNAYPPE